MTSITNLVPIRIDASSSDGAVHIIDTLLIDTKCLPISHLAPPNNGNPSSGLSSLSSAANSNKVSLSSLIRANATHLTESILADAEVHGAIRSKASSYMGGRLELLTDVKLYQNIEQQISNQFGIALGTEKRDLMSGGGSMYSQKSKSKPDAQTSGISNNEASSQQCNIVRIKLRLRHESFIVFDEFDYDINSSGMEGCDPFTIANSLVQDLKLPPELVPSIAASIVEQIYGVDVTESMNGFTSDVVRKTPAALNLDVTKDGTTTDFAQVMLSS